MTDAEMVRVLFASEPYWTAHAMKTQGSRFYQALGAAIDAADTANRRKVYRTWTAECWDFYQRGLGMEAAQRRGDGDGLEIDNRDELP